MPRLILHARDELREHHRRIRRPVTIVAAVELAVGAKHGDLHVRDATRPEHDGLSSALVHRTVADQPDIAAKLAPVSLDDIPQVRRSRLLLTLTDESNLRP